MEGQYMDVEAKLGDVFFQGGNNTWRKESSKTYREDTIYTDTIITPKSNDNGGTRIVDTEDDVESFVFIEHIQMEVHHIFKRKK